MINAETLSQLNQDELRQFGRDLYSVLRRVISEDEITKMAHISSCVSVFKVVKQWPLELETPTGSVSFTSDKQEVIKRGKSFTSFLEGKKNLPNGQLNFDFYEGQSVLSETAGLVLVRDALSEVFDDVIVLETPTSLDESVKTDDNKYQKGVDLFLMKQIINENGKEILVPLCGIDITLGDEKVIKEKQSYPAIQIATASPAIILPMRDLKLEGIGNTDTYFRKFLAYYAEAICEQGYTHPSCYSTPSEEQIWRTLILKKISNGLTDAIKSVELHSNRYPNVAAHPHTAIALQKAREMQRTIQEAINRN